MFYFSVHSGRRNGARFNATWTGPNERNANPFPRLYAELCGVIVEVDIESLWLLFPPRPMRLRLGYNEGGKRV